MKKKVFFLMLVIIAMVTSISITSCSKDDPEEPAEYYFQLTSVNTNCVGQDGELLTSAFKDEFISSFGLNANGRLLLAKNNREGAIKAFNESINNAQKSYEDAYAGKLPEGGYIEFYCELIMKSGSTNGPIKSSTIRITN